MSADGAQVEVTQGSIDMLLASPDRALRQSAWESYADGYLGVRNALAANLSARSSRRCSRRASVATNHRWRRRSPVERPVEVFDNLIATFEANLPTWHRYWGLRQRIDGVDRVAPYDLAAPLGAASPELEYEQCVRVDLRVPRAARDGRPPSSSGEAVSERRRADDPVDAVDQLPQPQ